MIRFFMCRVGLVASLTFFCILGAQASPLSVRDDMGRQVKLDGPAMRIISLAPHITENLFSAGAGAQIVGTVDHSDFPAAALELPRIGNYTTLNTEAILALAPDLVVAWQSGNPSSSVERLIKLGLTVYYSEPTNFEQILSNIERLSVLSGHSEKIAVEMLELRQFYQKLRANNAEKPLVRVFYQVWNEPLITLNGEHFVSRAIETCSGQNIFANEPTTAPRVNIEGVIAQNPQVILLGGHKKSQLEWQQKWAKWPVITAVSNQQVVFINPDLVSRPTKRLLEGMLDMCALLDVARTMY